MRFLADGPSIPGDLLLARDQGRVIFFCGAGVSRACANLPDFFGLARSVVAKLGVDPDSPACKLIQEAQEIDRRVGIAGVISADRVFGLLERDFSSRDIEEAVASALKPPLGCDLTAHNTLLDLATTPSGAVQLVTTNFDRLFDDCGRVLEVWQPPRLPDPLRPNKINGIVYLHGRATSDYSGAEGDGFILSSSEFGRAYLADGWATSFIREILGKYVIVFVGYTADDPPVQYLLEALRRASGKIENTYAFQSGGHNDAAARWRHKGVEAIPYSADNAHSALWETLKAWAERARNSEAWYAKVIEASKKGPAALQPYQRGQVAHIVSTYEGVKKFSAGEPPPAEWLCVFDRYRRFAKPGYVGSFNRKGPYVDPFESYGLDSDTPPSKLDPEDYYSRREAPSNAWDVFELTRADRSALRDENLAALRGHWAVHSPRLVPRIDQIGIWLAKVCDQPSAVWWASHQLSLHQSIQERISWEVERSDRSFDPNVREAWRQLFDAWSYVEENFRRDWYGLQASIGKDGWSSSVVRRLGEILRPRLLAKPDFWGGPKPPLLDANASGANRLIGVDVKYPDAYEKITVPKEWCAAVVRALRQNLELALALENEIGGYGLDNVSPIVPDADNDIDRYHRTHGLSGAVIQFSELYSQLLQIDKLAAKREFSSWPIDDDTIFARLRIWAAGKRSIVSDNDFEHVIASLHDKAFWDSRHQRDFLIVIAARWKKLSRTSRKSIEQRLLKGPTRWRREKSEAFNDRRVWSILSRLQWLQDSGCKFSASVREQMKLLRRMAPDWKVEHGAKAANSLEGRSGWVKTDTNHKELSDTVLSSILSRAEELSGRSSNFLIQNDPFTGLATQRPARAFSALTCMAKRGDFPEWAWRRFLNLEARKSDKPKLAQLIGARLLGYPDDQLAAIIRPAADWLRNVSTNLSKDCLPTFDGVFRKLTGVLHKYPSEGGSGIVRETKKPDWTMEAINSPAGIIAEALFNDPRQNDLQRGQGLPREWLFHLEELLALPDDLRRYVLVILLHNLNWFYAIDPKWTGERLLPVLNSGETDDRDAAWSGFLWGASAPSIDLCMRLKHDMLEFAKEPIPSRRSYTEIIAGMILAGWGTFNDMGERCISNDEMRSLLLKVDDDFRSHILWQAQRWSSQEDENTQTKWASQLTELLRIWPRQISARSPETSSRLCELAFSSGDQFPAISELVLPLVTKIERDHLMLPELRRSKDNIVDKYPQQALALLDAILPDNALAWPYGIEAVLERIGEADNSLNTDDRLIALRRRWDAR